MLVCSPTRLLPQQKAEVFVLFLPCNLQLDEKPNRQSHRSSQCEQNKERKRPGEKWADTKTYIYSFYTFQVLFIQSQEGFGFHHIFWNHANFLVTSMFRPIKGVLVAPLRFGRQPITDGLFLDNLIFYINLVYFQMASIKDDSVAIIND